MLLKNSIKVKLKLLLPGTNYTINLVLAFKLRKKSVKVFSYDAITLIKVKTIFGLF